MSPPTEEEYEEALEKHKAEEELRDQDRAYGVPVAKPNSITPIVASIMLILAGIAMAGWTRSAERGVVADASALALAHGRDVDRDLHLVSAAAEDHTFERAHVFVVAAPREQDMAVGGDLVVRRIEVDPAGLAAEDADPGMRRVGPDQTRAAGRRQRARGSR